MENQDNLKQKTEEIRQQLKRLNEAKAEALATLEKIDSDLEARRQDLGAAIATASATDRATKQLTEMQVSRDRAKLIVDAVDSQVEEVKRQLDKALEDEYQIELAKRRDKVKIKLIELVKTIEKAYKLAADIIGMKRRYDAQLKDKFGRGGLSFMGIPVEDMLTKMDFWLGRSSIGNRAMIDLLAEAGVSSMIERKAYLVKANSFNDGDL